jgi:hypothetical protein
VEFAEWPRSPQLELAIQVVASAARDSGPLAGREWAIANTTRDLKWRFDVPRRNGLRGPSHENHRCPPKEPAARPSVAQVQGADGSPSRGNARLHPLRQTSPLVRPSPSSQEELRNLIQTEVALMLGPYKLLLEEAKTAAEQQSRAAEEQQKEVRKKMIAGKEAEIASLKKELAETCERRGEVIGSSGRQPNRRRLQTVTRSVSRGRMIQVGGRCNGNSESRARKSERQCTSTKA